MTPKIYIFPHTPARGKWIKHQSNRELPLRNHALSQCPFPACIIKHFNFLRRVRSLCMWTQTPRDHRAVHVTTEQFTWPPSKRGHSAPEWAQRFPSTQETKRCTCMTTKGTSRLRPLPTVATQASFTKGIITRSTSLSPGHRKSRKSNTRILYAKRALCKENVLGTRVTRFQSDRPRGTEHARSSSPPAPSRREMRSLT